MIFENAKERLILPYFCPHKQQVNAA